MTTNTAGPLTDQESALISMYRSLDRYQKAAFREITRQLAIVDARAAKRADVPPDAA